MDLYSGESTMNTSAPGQGLLALLVMIAVIGFILAYCFWGSCCRMLCSPPTDVDTCDSPEETYSPQQPALVLMPDGRIWLIDSQGNIHESDESVGGRRRQQDTSKEEDSEEAVIDMSPPTYDSIFGGTNIGPPPSYEEFCRTSPTSNTDSNSNLRL